MALPETQKNRVPVGLVSINVRSLEVADGENEFLSLSVQTHRSCRIEQECSSRSRKSFHVGLSVKAASLTRLQSPRLLFWKVHYLTDLSLHVDYDDTQCQKWWIFEDLMCRVAWRWVMKWNVWKRPCGVPVEKQGIPGLRRLRETPGVCLRNCTGMVASLWFSYCAWCSCRIGFFFSPLFLIIRLRFSIFLSVLLSYTITEETQTTFFYKEYQMCFRTAKA